LMAPAGRCAPAAGDGTGTGGKRRWLRRSARGCAGDPSPVRPLAWPWLAVPEVAAERQRLQKSWGLVEMWIEDANGRAGRARRGARCPLRCARS